MFFEDWWLSANDGANTTDKDSKYPLVKELAKAAFMAGADAVKSLPHRAMFDEGICVGKVMGAKECIKIIHDSIWDKSGTLATAREEIKAKYGIVE